MSKIIRIANGQGFWGDSLQAPIDLIKKSNIDYLTLDYLAEVTMSIMQKQKNKNNGVLVKFHKKKQDKRIDLPTVGLHTLKQCKFAGLKGIVLKHKNNIFLDKIKAINYANKNKMFILVK